MATIANPTETLTERLAARAQHEIRKHVRSIEKPAARVAAVTLEMDISPSGEPSDTYCHITYHTERRAKAKRPT